MILFLLKFEDMKNILEGSFELFLAYKHDQTCWGRTAHRYIRKKHGKKVANVCKRRLQKVTNRLDDNSHKVEWPIDAVSS